MMNLKLALQSTTQYLDQDKRQFFQDYKRRVANTDEWSVAVVERLEEYCLRSGKAVRPLLVAIGAALSQGKVLADVLQQPDVRQTMLIVELKHKRIIMADDISDQDEMRHGKPAMHVNWYQDLDLQDNYHDLGEIKLKHVARSYTEVAGLWLQSMTNWLLADEVFTDQQRCTLLRIFQLHTYDRTATGWYIIFDQGFEKLTSQTSEDRLLKGLELVSGEYTFVGPLRLGLALSKDSNQSLEESLTKYGESAGILFQITDDIIGAFGDPQITGKPVGGDFREGKKTLLVQHAYRQGTQQQQQALVNLIGKDDLNDQEIKQIQNIMIETKAVDYAQQRATEFAQQAKDVLAGIPDSQSKDILLELVDFVLKRQK